MSLYCSVLFLFNLKYLLLSPEHDSFPPRPHFLLLEFGLFFFFNVLEATLECPLVFVSGDCHALTWTCQAFFLDRRSLGMAPALSPLPVILLGTRFSLSGPLGLLLLPLLLAVLCPPEC